MTQPGSPYIRLMRLDKPIGILLLLWPTWWALWWAADGWPDARLLLIFTLGVVVMRSAGCVINDYADRHLDGQVARTRGRPLATGEVSTQQAMRLFFALLLIAAGLALLLNREALLWSLLAAGLAVVYPFMKRYTDWPQVFLAAAFGCSIIIAFAATRAEVPTVAWLLFFANLCWVVAYDTQYAMVDKADDLQAGIRSTAIRFGQHDRWIIGLLQTAFVVLLWLAGALSSRGWLYDAGLLLAWLLLLHQQWMIRQRDTGACFQAFLHNSRVGACVFIGLLLDTVL